MSKKRILVIGGVAGGASFATRARRLSEHATIIIFERDNYISFANCGLPYHIGGEITARYNLILQTPEQMQQRYNIDVRINSEVIKINREQKTIVVKDNITGREYSESYDVLVLSPGAKPTLPPIPGIKNAGIFTLRNISDMDAINNWIDNHQPQNALIIGGGYIGLEMAEALHRRKLAVTIAELALQIMGPIDAEMATLLYQELTAQGVKLHLGAAVTAFASHDNKIEVTLEKNATSEDKETKTISKIITDMVILAIGVKPETELAKNADLKIGERGGIVVDEHMQTSDPNVYAVGDAVEITDFVMHTPTLVPLAGPANRQGRIAANNIFGHHSAYQGTQGTGICKIFNLTVGMTGVNEKILIRNKKIYEKIYLHTLDHASYYPGATPIHLKLLFNPQDGEIYGAQAIGAKGIARRIDVIATAMRAKLKAYDLVDEELSYAPPYGAAKDLVNYAGFAVANVMDGTVSICHTQDMLQTDDATQLILDVRTRDEVLCGTIPNSINIPLDELRQRLDELPRDKELLTFCKVGLRGYLACRILMQHNFACRNLSGGYTTYLMATAAIANTNTDATISQCKVTPHHKETRAKHVDDMTQEENLPKDEKEKIAKSIDARGLQCPGPIQQLKIGIGAIQNDEVLVILTTDLGFLTDAPAWCKATGNSWISSEIQQDGSYRTMIRKNSNKKDSTSPSVSVSAPQIGATNIDQQQYTNKKKLTIVVFSGDLDKALAAFIIANGAVAMNYEPTLFFTFWGLNILRKDQAPTIEKNLIEKMFAFMMPRGAKKLALSKMNMCGLGTEMIKSVMQYKNVNSLPELMHSAQQANVKLIACNMSMDLMGLRLEELIDNIEVGGVATYLQQATAGNINLFI